MFDGAHAAELTPQLTGRHERGEVVPPERHDDVLAQLLRTSGEVPRVGRVDGDRLLHQDVGAGLHRGDGLFVVEPDRAGDDAHVHPFGQDVAVVLTGHREAELFLDLGQFFGALAADTDQLDLVGSFEQRGDV